MFRFAIMGAGKISNKFCDAVRRLEGCEVTAVAGRSLQRAEEFAAKNGVRKAYSDYEEMLKAEKPDCVYIGTVTSSHYPLTMLCLNYHVPVLCEKAMFMDSNQAETVFRRSKEQGVFVMEAMWSRFLPPLKKAKQWLEVGRIGKPAYCETTIGFQAPKDKENRYYNAALGGGASYDITVYAYELTAWMLAKAAEEIQVSCVWSDTGVDLTDHVALRFRDALASLTTTFAVRTESRMIIYGETGKILLPNSHVAKEAFLYDRNGELEEHYIDRLTENGFTYEVQEVMDCIRAGKIESNVVPHKDTLDCARLFDQIWASKKG